MRRGIIIFCFAVGLGGQTIKDTSPRTLASQIYSQLGTPPDGTVVYCADCTAASPTAAGGFGVVVARENGVWNSRSSGGGGGSTGSAPAGLTITGSLYGVGETSTLIESDSLNRSDLSTGVYRKIRHSGTRTPTNNGNTYGLVTEIGIFGGSNYYDYNTGVYDKKTQGGELMLINFSGSGQKSGHGVIVSNSGMGDSYGYDSYQNVDGHFDAMGDEVVGGQYRGYTIQQPTEFTGAITATTRPTCNTTTTAAIDKSYTATGFVTVPVVSTAGCAVGDWITFAITQYATPGYTTTVARINTIVDATHFTAIIQHAQPSGATVTPCTRLVISGMTTDYRDVGLLGQGRLAIITDGPTYTTGQIDGIANSGSGYFRVTAKAGTGVNWTTNMVGGDANGIGLLCPDIDKWAMGGSSNMAHACWPILQLDGDSQHLRVFNYNGQMGASGGSYTYTIYPGTRIEWLETTATSTDLAMTAVIMRTNSFAWTPGKTFLQPLDPWVIVTYQHYAYCQVDGPIGGNAPCGTSYQAINAGKAMGLAAFGTLGRGDITKPDWVYGMKLGGGTQAGGIFIGGKDFADIGISLYNVNDLKKITWQGGSNPNGVSNLYSSNAGFVVDNFDSKLKLINSNLNDAVTLDFSGAIGRTITFPNRTGQINLSGPGPQLRSLPAAVNDYVNIGSWTDTQTGGIHLDMSCTAAGQLAGRHWTADTRYNLTGGAWRILGGEDSGAADPGDNYIAEISVSGFTNSVRLRRTAAASGGQNVWCYVLGYGSQDSNFAPSAIFTASTTSGTETSPSTTYLAGSLITQSTDTATINGKLALGSVAAYTCNAASRGHFNYIAGAAGVKDIVQVCVKSATDVYSWASIY